MIFQQKDVETITEFKDESECICGYLWCTGPAAAAADLHPDSIGWCETCHAIGREDMTGGCRDEREQ